MLNCGSLRQKGLHLLVLFGSQHCLVSLKLTHGGGLLPHGLLVKSFGLNGGV
jgi:hypothetical protein